MTIRLLIFLAFFLWSHWNMHPSIPSIPPEVIEAARAITGVADKWGHVADAILSWHLPAALVVGGVVMFVLMGLWSSKK